MEIMATSSSPQAKGRSMDLHFQFTYYSLNTFPARWESNSYGYHGDDGHKFHASGKGEEYGPAYGTGDVIGAGIHLGRKEMFFTCVLCDMWSRKHIVLCALSIWRRHRCRHSSGTERDVFHVRYMRYVMPQTHCTLCVVPYHQHVVSWVQLRCDLCWQPFGAWFGSWKLEVGSWQLAVGSWQYTNVICTSIHLGQRVLLFAWDAASVFHNTIVCDLCWHLSGAAGGVLHVWFEQCV